MSGQNESIVPRASVDWRLSFRAVRVHNVHLSGGQAVSSSCGICTQGLGGALARIAPVEKPTEKSKVAEGDGDNKKESTTSPSSDWADYWGESDKVLEKG